MTDLESLILTKLGEHGQKNDWLGVCICGWHSERLAQNHKPLQAHVASVLAEAATDAGYVLCREQVGWLARNGALLPYVEKYAHMAVSEDRPLYVPVSDPSEGE